MRIWVGIKSGVKEHIEDLKQPPKWWETDPWQSDSHRTGRHKELLWTIVALVVGLPLMLFVSMNLETWVKYVAEYGTLYIAWMPPTGWFVAVLTVVSLGALLSVTRRRINRDK